MSQPQTPVVNRPWQPTSFACAVAALTALDDAPADESGSCIFLTKPASPGWQVWARVTDWRVDEGDTVFANMEVQDNATDTPSGRLKSMREPTSERLAWAEGKVQQLNTLMQEARREEQSILRWVAAMVDVMPLAHMGEALNFRWSDSRNEAELSAGNVVMRVRRMAEGWRLEANQRLGRMEPVTRLVPVGCNENEALLEVLFDAWIYGRRHG